MAERLDAWLALWRTPGIGPAAYATLLEHFGTPEAAISQPPSALRALRLPEETVSALSRPDWGGAETDLAWASGSDRHILRIVDPQYPPLLKQIALAPPILFVEGRLDCLDNPQLAIVGTRNPSAGGRRFAAEFSSELAASGLVITSGLALGVDAVAHDAALKTGGVSIAVMGHGLDRVYPAGHRALARRLAELGALVSEFPIGTLPKADHFPRRNRIISGLSLGVLVVEAAHRSGSLITARYAAEQGRELFAIPGSIRNPMSAGCHRLIRDGATLVESPAQILEGLASVLGPILAAPVSSPESDRRDNFAQDLESALLLKAMGFDPVTIDELVERSGLSAEGIASRLLELELRGIVGGDAGGRYQRVARF